MRVVVALGGNALLQRGQALSANNQRANVKIAARALAPIAERHELIISHGNGPQVGLLALQSEAYAQVEPYPLDILGAQTEGMIGYMIEQELGNLLPFERPFATVLTMIEVHRDDPAFQNPTKFIGPIYNEQDAKELAARKGWVVKRDGAHWRRVVASPKPQRIFEIRPLRWLLERNTVLICGGGGGIPTAYDEQGNLCGVEAVIDKDFASSLLASELDADFYIMATDVDAVYRNWGTPEAERLSVVTPDQMAGFELAEGSMGPKILGACEFVRKTGKRAAIGSLSQIDQILEGRAGTLFQPDGC